MHQVHQLGRMVMPRLSTEHADAVTTHAPKELIRISVSDGLITIFITGCLLEQSAVERLRAELDFVTAVCRGIVTLDLTDCDELGPEAAQVLLEQQDAACAPQSRCDFRVVAHRPSTIRAASAAGIPLEHDMTRTEPVPRPRHVAGGATRLPVQTTTSLQQTQQQQQPAGSQTQTSGSSEKSEACRGLVTLTLPNR